MIARRWRGWTEPQNADTYETLFEERGSAGRTSETLKGYWRWICRARNTGRQYLNWSDYQLQNQI
jgi:hypothetical protein